MDLSPPKFFPATAVDNRYLSSIRLAASLVAILLVIFTGSL